MSNMKLTVRLGSFELNLEASIGQLYLVMLLVKLVVASL